MKKLLLFIMLFFLGVFSAYAANKESFYAGEWIPNIYINKVKDGTIHYRQARYIRKESDKEIAYCLEPFEIMKTDEDYKGYTDDYAKRLGLSESVWKKINLIAYYGYGYSNHTSDKWYAITQVMIWREVDKKAEFYFTDSLNGNKITKYDDEIKEITSLINEHNKTPSFSNKTYNFSINSINTIEDSNKVLKNFSITSSNKSINIEKNKNNLVIKTNTEAKETITFERNFNKYNNKTIVFIDSKAQNVMVPGNVDSIKFTLKISVISGKIIINKVDFDTEEKIPQGEGVLVGSRYNIYNSNNEIIDTLEIGEDYKAVSKSLAFGKYIIKEEKSMEGYLLDTEEYELEISSNNLNIELTLKNKAIKSIIEIYKYFGDKLESGINFEIYNSKGELIDTVTTDEFGKIEKELYYGTYKFHQVNSTKNYLCVDDFEVKIDESSPEVIRLDLFDEKFSSKLVTIKRDKETGEIIKEETIFKILNLDKDEYLKIEGSDELKTKEGVLTIDKIEAGNYELEEYKPPKGYQKLNQKIKFNIDDENMYEKDENNYPVYEIAVDNEKEVIEVEVPNTNQEYVEKTSFLLQDKKKKLTIFS